MSYQCAKCGAEVVKLQTGEFVRSCGHESSPVVANLQCCLEGKSAIK